MKSWGMSRMVLGKIGLVSIVSYPLVRARLQEGKNMFAYLF